MFRTPTFFVGWGILPFYRGYSQHILSLTDRTVDLLSNMKNELQAILERLEEEKKSDLQDHPKKTLQVKIDR